MRDIKADNPLPSSNAARRRGLTMYQKEVNFAMRGVPRKQRRIMAQELNRMMWKRRDRAAVKKAVAEGAEQLLREATAQPLPIAELTEEQKDKLRSLWKVRHGQ